MIAYLLRQPGHVDRVVVSDDPMPPKERARLERGGFSVTAVTPDRARSASDWTSLVTPLLQVDLFA
jgi:hypothetical protein